MKKKLLFLCIPFFLIMKTFAESPPNQENKPLVVGTTSGYAPYVSLDAKGQYEGFDIDLAELLAKKLNRKLVIKDCGSMPSLMISLQQGKVDVLIWAISITNERMKNIEMVYYQGEKVVEMPVLFWGKAPDIKSLEDLGKDPKKAVCVEAGSYQESVLKGIPNINLKFTDSVSGALMEIKYGKSFAMMIDPSLLPRITAQHPEVRVVNIPLPPEEHSLGNGICISKANQELANEVRKAIEELTLEGEIAQLEKKWNMKG
ncbi:MAG: transporter substrate-binding domain-containing protein [Chlamydiae bacterium]|nr:transporter substrate-binding domain-containing protein [Chlamydiota bacterium]